MQLNDQQIELLKTVRLQMDDPTTFASTFICVNVINLFRTNNGTEQNPTEETGPLYVDITKAVMAALKPASSVFIYIRKEVSDFADLPIKTQDYYSRLARLAWLDRMIETRTIA